MVGVCEFCGMVGKGIIINGELFSCLNCMNRIEPFLEEEEK